ncbi:MAG: hypothetical protein AAB388_02995 [Patescibacteria group bacterium]
MEKVTLQLFRAAMILCASLAIVVIWLGEEVVPEALFKTVATLFIFGLPTSFFGPPSWLTAF